METPAITNITNEKNNGNLNKITMIILTILGVTDHGKKAINFTRDEALAIYRKLIAVSIIIAIAYLLSFIANVLNFKGINYFPFFLFVIISGILRIHPVHNAIAAYLGALIEALENGSSPSKGAIKYLKLYQKYLNEFISYGALVFWGLAVIPLQGNAMTSLAIFSTLIMLLIMGIGGNFCKYLINIFVILVLIYFSYQAFQQNVKGSAAVNKAETICSEIYKGFLNYLNNKPPQAAAPSATTEEATKMATATVNTNLFPLSTKPGQEYFIPLQPYEEINVDKLKRGDRWEYPEANGTFAQRVFKSKGTCWGTMKKPDNWTADYDGTLQVKNLSGYPITVHLVRL